VTQQQLADHVGTAREVVARVLRELREAGIVLTTKRQLEITDPARLAAIAGRKSSPVFQGKAPAAVDQNRQLRPEAPARLP
jgi:DNA-binding transcriptional regulator LsrR (DeoR family)